MVYLTNPKTLNKNYMESQLGFIFTIIVVLVIGISSILYFINKKLQGFEHQKDDERVIKLEQNIDNLSKSVSEQKQLFYNQLSSTTEQINKQLHNNARLLQESQKNIGSRLDHASKAYVGVTSKLTQLEEANKRIYDVGKDISSLQEILRSPKLRGALGELFLGDLLAQILPNKNFKLQHIFKSREVVDAIIQLRDGVIIPIDAKFPLENFKKMIEADEPDQRKHKKEFSKDVKKRIDEIATKYILPDEGTLDFALMYIPAENVYYEIIIKDEEGEGLMTYALDKRVIPVSPNSFYSYLQTILLGLKGMEVESSAKEILNHLGRLRGDFDKFSEQYRVLGGHLTHANKSFTEGEKRLEKFDDKLEMASGSQNKLLD